LSLGPATVQGDGPVPEADGSRQRRQYRRARRTAIVLGVIAVLLYAGFIAVYILRRR
jgi:hypothetical protein